MNYWKPDWGRLTAKDECLKCELGGEQEQDTIPVSVEGGGLYRLLEHPFFVSECLRWGDLVRAEREREWSRWPEAEPLIVTEVVERLPHRHCRSELIDGKPHAGLLLDAIMAAGGFWQDDELQGFDAFVPPDFDVEAWERENEALIVRESPPMTAFENATLARSERRAQRLKDRQPHRRNKLADLLREDEDQ